MYAAIRAQKGGHMTARFVLFCFVFPILPLWGQTGLSTVRGTVSDSSGAVVPGASLEIVDVLTNVRRQTVSNEVGNFEIPELKPGTYRLRAQMGGFKTHIAEGILLESNSIRRIDVTFE